MPGALKERAPPGGGGGGPSRLCRTVPTPTEISPVPGFSFIWVKCTGSSGPRWERQFDGSVEGGRWRRELDTTRSVEGEEETFFFFLIAGTALQQQHMSKKKASELKLSDPRRVLEGSRLSQFSNGLRPSWNRGGFHGLFYSGRPGHSGV